MQCTHIIMFYVFNRFTPKSTFVSWMPCGIQLKKEDFGGERVKHDL